jgi:hypothetical protein
MPNDQRFSPHIVKETLLRIRVLGYIEDAPTPPNPRSVSWSDRRRSRVSQPTLRGPTMPIPTLAALPRAMPADAADRPALVQPHAVSLRELTVADGASADIGELTASVRTRLLLLGPSGRALARISSAIEGCRPEVLHIVAHGRAGAVCLGGQWIGTRDLAAASGMLAKWNVAIVALWSCHGGADQTLGQVLAALTGARVLVSPGPLGMVDGAPRWELMDADGGPAPARFCAPFADPVMRSWPHQLAGA